MTRCTEGCRTDEEIDEFLKTWDVTFEYNNQNYLIDEYGANNTADRVEYVIFPMGQGVKKTAAIT